MQDAKSGLNRLYESLAAIGGLEKATDDSSLSLISGKDRKKLASIEKRFIQAMDNDFNTAQALGHLFEAAKIVNKVIGALGNRQSPGDLELLDSTARTISELAAIAGILRENPDEFLARQKKEILARIDIAPSTIEQLIVQRNEARATKDWAMSDQIRDRLLGHGIELKDGPAGTSWDVKRD